MEDPIIGEDGDPRQRVLTKREEMRHQHNEATLREAIRIIEERIEKRSAQLKNLMALIDTLPEDEPTPTIVVTPGSIPPPPPLDALLQRQAEENSVVVGDPLSAPEDDRITKAEAIKKAKELSSQIDLLKEVLASGLKNSINELKSNKPSAT